MTNDYLKIIEEEEKRKFFWYSLTAWTLALLATGAAIIAITWILQFPNTQIEQDDKRGDPTNSIGNNQTIEASRH